MEGDLIKSVKHVLRAQGDDFEVEESYFKYFFKGSECFTFNLIPNLSKSIKY